MRLIGVFKDQKEAERFSFYLKKQGITAVCEPLLDQATSAISYQCWVHDEDHLAKAEADFRAFTENPQDEKFGVFEEEPKEPLEIPQEPISARRARAPFTCFIILLCAFIYLMNALEEFDAMKENPKAPQLVLTPIEEAMLFDVPPPFKEGLTPEALAKAPFWRGAYSYLVLKIRGQDTAMAEGPLFTQIREGEVWRLITPVLLHGNLLHILFNMIWVWVLCFPIELRIGMARLFLLSLIIGIVSNVAQYLMSGPLFLGYSGIIMGLVGFIWMREKMAPWEGYPLKRSTLLFLGLFVGGVFLLQCATLILQLFTSLSFDPNIANTAHIVGAIAGAALARLPFFAVRVRA